jgi:hypothetical protein
MPHPDRLKIDLERWCSVGRGRSYERRRHRFLRDEQHPVNRMNLERDAEATQYAGLRRGALASGKFGEIGRREYQRSLSIQMGMPA